jgi:signal transduction histidine kinase/ActR/RegA family two-component response regulator
MWTVLLCVHEKHDPRLVVLAALICVVAVTAAFGFYHRSRRGSAGFRAAWLGLTGVVGGSGVWATHFIAMLAYEPRLNIHYDVAVTALSWVVAVAGVGAGFAVAGWGRSVLWRLGGGALVGFGIAGMHFVGMMAVRLRGLILWNESFVIASIAIGVAFGAAALMADAGRPGLRRRIAASGLLVLGIVGLHFTAMAATVILPGNGPPLAASLIDRGVLAVVIGALIAIIFAASGALIWVERFVQGATLHSVRASLGALSSGIAFFGRDDRLIVWNAAFEALLGQPKLAAGMPRRAVLAPDGGGLAAAFDGVGGLRGRLEASPGGATVIERELAGGRWLKLEARVTADGGLAVVLTDTTDTNSYARTLAAARDAAEAANRSKSEFLANMSHEIRTPLNGVLGIADALGRTRLTAQQASMVRIIHDSGEALDALLGDILDLARVEAGEIALDPQPVKVSDICASVAALFADRAREKGLTLGFELGAGVETPVLADPLRLRQILTNLVANAVKFTQAGAVTLAASRTGAAFRLEVRDTGCGFDPALKDGLFQRFRQADGSATRQHGGAGLGLPLCQRLAALMGGRLDCDSTPGAGSVFVLEADFPAVEAAAPAATVAEARAPRVLVVDDNAVNRQVLELILDSAGVDHAAAENGRDALAAFQGGDFDAVLMDIQMPVMDGLEATRRIRRWEAETGTRERPIIIVSANCLPEHVAAGEAAGANGHIAKPVSAGKVLSALTEGLARAA